MDTETIELTPEAIKASAQRWAAWLRGPVPTRPANVPEQVTIKLSLDQASVLYEKLERVVDDRWPPELGKEGSFRNNPIYLLSRLDLALKNLPATIPQANRKGKVVRLLEQGLQLTLRPHEAAYLLRILGNHKRDKWRRENQEQRLLAPLEVAEIAEEGDEENPCLKPFLSPSHHENPQGQVQRSVLQQALSELPCKLRMAPGEVAALLSALTEADGNVSEAARQLGQPQRKTARRIERILRHLKSRGFSA